MLERLDVLQNRECEQEEYGGKRKQDGECCIETAVKLQPRTAARTLRKMLLVVFPHLRRDAGDIVAPASQNGAYHAVSALSFRHNSESLVLRTTAESRMMRGAAWQRTARRAWDARSRLGDLRFSAYLFITLN